MAKKSIDYSGLLNTMNENAKKEIQTITENEKKREVEKEEEKKEEKRTEVKIKEPVAKKETVISRREARPIQKTVHLTEELNNKVNLMKAMMVAKGEKTTFEDILFDRLQEWVNKNFDKMMSEIK